MKESPEIQRLNAMLRSSCFAAEGFMGSDDRSVSEIIQTDAGECFRLGYTAAKIAQKMQEITEQADHALGSWVDIDESREARVEEARGAIPCPWPHGGMFRKRVTTLRLKGSGETLQWSDLNVHFIGAHGFFEGKGSFFRQEPARLIQALF